VSYTLSDCYRYGELGDVSHTWKKLLAVDLARIDDKSVPLLAVIKKNGQCLKRAAEMLKERFEKQKDGIESSKVVSYLLTSNS
jgi:hypothetical protein